MCLGKLPGSVPTAGKSVYRDAVNIHSLFGHQVVGDDIGNGIELLLVPSAGCIGTLRIQQKPIEGSVVHRLLMDVAAMGELELIINKGSSFTHSMKEKIQR